MNTPEGLAGWCRAPAGRISVDEDWAELRGEVDSV